MTITDRAKLKRSVAGRDNLGSADGNVYYDLTTGEIQFLDVTEVPLVNGQPNELIRAGGENGGLTGVVFNDFNYHQRKDDEDLQFFYASFDGGLKEVGQYYNTYGWTFAGTDDTGDIKMFRGTGIEYRDNSGVSQKTFFGASSLTNISANTQPTFQLEKGGAITPFYFKGNVDEPVKVYDVNTSFDKREYFSIEVAQAGSIFSKVEYLKGTGGYSTLIGAGESPDSNMASLVEDNAGTIQFVAGVPTLSNSDFITTPETITGFAEGDGTFNFLFDNTDNNYPVATIAAALQKLKVDGVTINFPYLDNVGAVQTISLNAALVGNFFEYKNGKYLFTNPLYGYENLLPANSTVSPSFFIKTVASNEEQSVLFTEHGNTERSYLFEPIVRVDFGEFFNLDTDAYYRVQPFNRTGNLDFENETSVTSQDSSSNTLADLISVKGRYLEYKTLETGEFIVIASGVDTLKSNNAVFTLDGVTAITPVQCRLDRRTA